MFSFLLLTLWVNQCLAENEKIYFISHAGAGDPFWSIEFKGAQKAASEVGVNLQIVAPERPGDIAQQVELLKAALATHPQGLALSVPDDNAFASSLQQAKQKGIPVVVFNARPSPEKEKQNPYAAFIGMDEYKAGVLVGERALKTGQIKKRAVVAIHQAGHIGLERRAKGIQDALSKQGVVVDKLDITSDASQAQVIVRGYLKKHPDTSALFCLGPQGLHPLGQMVKDDKKKLYLASFDMSPFTLKLIKEGVLDFTIDQQPYLQGYLSVIQLALASRIKTSPSSVDTGGGIVDKSNVDEVAKLVLQGVR